MKHRKFAALKGMVIFMMRYGKRVMSVMLSLALLGTSVSLTGCGSSKKAENGELNLFIWTEYVPDSVISDFEKEYGIKVNVSTFSSNEDMLAKVKSCARNAMGEKPSSARNATDMASSQLAIIATLQGRLIVPAVVGVVKRLLFARYAMKGKL